MGDQEGRFSGRGLIHSTQPTVNVDYSIEVWIERREVNTMGGCSIHEGLLDMRGTIKSDDDLFDVFRESNPALQLEGGRRIGIMIEQVDFIQGTGQIVMNGGWLD